MRGTSQNDRDFDLMDKALEHLYSTEPRFFDSKKCMNGYRTYVESRFNHPKQPTPLPAQERVLHNCIEEKCNEKGKLIWFDRGNSVKCEASGIVHRCSGDVRCAYRVLSPEGDRVCYLTGRVVGQKFSHEIEDRQNEDADDENIFTRVIYKDDPSHPHFIRNLTKTTQPNTEGSSLESKSVSKSKKGDTENFKKPLKKAKTEQSPEKKVRNDIQTMFSTLVYNTARHEINKLLNEEVTLSAKFEVEKRIKTLKKEGKTISACEVYQILMEQTLKKKFLPEAKYNPVQEDYYVALVLELWNALSAHTQKISPSNFTLGCLYLIVPSHDDGQAVWHDVFLRDILPDKLAFEKLPDVYEGYHKKIKTSKAKIITAYRNLSLDQKNVLIVNLMVVHEFYSKKIQLGPMCPFLGIFKTRDTNALSSRNQE
jgi:hypothetical protein